VPPARFADVFNGAQLATAPALAVAANSPTFLGHRLWHETRVALFKQAVDDRGGDTSRESRVGLGSEWVREGALEIFARNVERHEPLLPVVAEEDPLERVRAGGVPQLTELRLHQGTVWHWNRAVYDPVDGGHLRVELRSLPAGPTTPDMLANTAFLVGLTLGLAADADAWTGGMPFARVEHNFYRAAQQGLDATLAWTDGPGGEPIELRAAELVRRLLPIARKGLEDFGVEPAECEWARRVGAARAGSARRSPRSSPSSAGPGGCRRCCTPTWSAPPRRARSMPGRCRPARGGCASAWHRSPMRSPRARSSSCARSADRSSCASRVATVTAPVRW
jgi:hypothetical protein